jgi:hypothetical protein
VDLYRDRRVFRSGIVLNGGAPARITLASADTGFYYQIRATLPAGNLAVSQAVWVWSDRLTYVLVDASPWANVTIQGPGNQPKAGAQQTPFTAALLPGATYQFHFENPDLKALSTLDKSFAVPVPGDVIHETMPGFDPARTVDDLMRAPASAR